jgi:hypothetical protein
MESDRRPPLNYVEVTEQKRLNAAREQGIPWKKWGPYLSEREWGTVREDYSADGNAWDYFTQDQSRSRAYRWGEDGIAGISDDKQQLCFARALWNGRDPIPKERMFGLTNSESNHGEDVKEYYFYIDSTPTHSYMKYLYKYPQGEYPYRDLVETNRRRSREEMEYELLDTGIFDEDRYFDVFVEYAKADAEDALVGISVHNRGPETTTMHLLPTLWFRNTWSWGDGKLKPVLGQVDQDKIHASHPELGNYTLQCEGVAELLFTENESNAGCLWGQANAPPYVKDAFHEYVIAGKGDAVNPSKSGTKAAAHYVLEVPVGGREVVRLWLSEKPVGKAFVKFDEVFASRLADTNEFYERITPATLSEDERRVHRQALAGMLWSKQYYYDEMSARFLEHFLWITYAMDRMGVNHDEMWDSEDGFFYDLLHFPNGNSTRLKIRSLVGPLPLCAAIVFGRATAKHPRVLAMMARFRERYPEVAAQIATADDPKLGGYIGRRLVAVCNKEKLQRILVYILDEKEFLSTYGIRSLSKFHLDHPFVFNLSGQEYKVQYLPAESNTGMFGGNSKRRGPIWRPVNALIIRGLLQMYPFYGPDFKVECPTGSGKDMTLFEVAHEIARRLSSIFLRDANGQRPVYGRTKKFQDDPHWRDYILYYEYFHGENGAGLGASHQTGWTGLIARSLDLFTRVTAEMAMETPKTAIAAMTREQVAGQKV